MTKPAYVWFTDEDVDIVGDHICSKCLQELPEDSVPIMLFRERRLWGAFHGPTLCCKGSERACRTKVANEVRVKLNLGWSARELTETTTDVARFHESCFNELLTTGDVKLEAHKK